MVHGLYSVAEVDVMIKNGDKLLLAGDAPLLSQLSKGDWIGGSCSRFVGKERTPVNTREKIFVHNVTDVVNNFKIVVYDASNVKNIYDEAFEHGFSVLILPFYSDVWREYSINCSNYFNFANSPVCGWVAVAPPYSEYEQNDESLVFSGESGLSYKNSAVVMHIELSVEKYAEIHVFSPFKADDDDIIVFEENGQQVEYALVNGVRQNFRQYLLNRGIDRSHDAGEMSRKCLAGNFSGFIMNVSIGMETENDLEKYVSLGAPVYKGVPYRLANMDKVSYAHEKKQLDVEVACAFTCITNFAHSDIFQKHLTQMYGPFTYGEIGYFLLNQGTVYLTVGNLQKQE